MKQPTNGSNQVATLTADLDRLEAFYAEVFEATPLFDQHDAGHRHAMIMLGPFSGLHAFEVDAARVPDGTQPMFGRGRLDHVAITAADAVAFEKIRQRAVAMGASAEVVDYGPMLAFNLEDPEGAEIEVCWVKPGVDLSTPPPDRAAAASRIRS